MRFLDIMDGSGNGWLRHTSCPNVKTGEISMITSKHRELGSPQSYTTAVEDAPASAKSRDASEIPSRDSKYELSHEPTQ